MFNTKYYIVFICITSVFIILGMQLRDFFQKYTCCRVKFAPAFKILNNFVNVLAGNYNISFTLEILPLWKQCFQSCLILCWGNLSKFK